MLIKYIENFLTPYECKSIIELGESINLFEMKSSYVVNGKTIVENVSYSGNKRMGNYSILVNVSSKKTSTNNSSKTISAINIPTIPAVNVDLFPDLNWNDHVAGKNTLYDFNQDGVPDIITYKRVSEKSTLPAIFEIKDYFKATYFISLWFGIVTTNPTMDWNLRR